MGLKKGNTIVEWTKTKTDNTMGKKRKQNKTMVEKTKTDNTMLNIKIDASSPEHGQTESIMVRDDQPDSPETLTGVETNEFLTILGGTHSYTLHWSNGIPRKFAKYTKGVELNQYVRVGMCMPSDATFNLFTRTPLRRLKLVDWTEVQSIEELDSDTLGISRFGKYKTNGWKEIINCFVNYRIRGLERSETSSL
ncbi:TEME2 [Mytilus edulis]|uniref:TEME2 n=1 Tax=Mytilus edulis TaxID=6550 RepID=A0A8S3SZD3_MYTED|nr:TEME2 [Mytilus edulis]